MYVVALNRGIIYNLVELNTEMDSTLVVLDIGIYVLTLNVGTLKY